MAVIVRLSLYYGTKYFCTKLLAFGQLNILCRSFYLVAKPGISCGLNASKMRVRSHTNTRISTTVEKYNE